MSQAEPIVTMPATDALRRLAISPSGFVFDPVTGNSFSVNETGQAILRLLAETSSLPELIESLTGEFDVEPLAAERDAIEFIAHLRAQIK